MQVFFVNTARSRRANVWYVLLLCAALTMLLAACGGQSHPPTTQGVQVPSLPLPSIGGLPALAAGLQPTGQLDPTLKLQLTIGLAINRKALASDLAALYDPNSAQFGHYLTPQQLTTRYGASQATIDKVTGLLQTEGFEVLAVSPLRDQITVSATVAQIAQTFHVTLQTFQKDGQTFFGPSGDATLPAALTSLVTSVVGLNNFAQPSPHLGLSATPAALGQHPAVDCANSKQNIGVTPSQVAANYGYSDAYKAGYTGKGISIGVLEFNDDVATSDLTTFLRCMSSATLHRSIIRVNGGATLPDALSTEEATLDFEYLGTLAPDAQLVEYQSQYCQIQGACTFFGSNATFAQAYTAVLNRIAADGSVQVVSASWGGPEIGFTKDELFALDQSIEYLGAEGITFAAASGDCGAFDAGEFNKLAADFPSADPYTLAVGGTFLHVDAQGKRSSEPVWFNAKPDKSKCLNSWGGGGGVSVIFSQPSWQQGTGVKNQYANGHRQEPDVAATAFNLAFLDGGQWSNGGGGTSAAAPIWAAGIALVDQGLMQQSKQVVGAPATFYRVANKHGSFQPYFDITEGNNLYYPATTGYDISTGWGVPNILDFGKALGAF